MEYLRCVECGNHPLLRVDNSIYCNNPECFRSSNPFINLNEKPILVDFKESVLDEEIFVSIKGSSAIKRTSIGLMTKIRSLFRIKNKITIRNVSFLENEIKNITEPRILVIGGGEIGSGMDALYERYNGAIISFDIYSSPHINFIADAHNIPIVSEYFDLVIIQAVLEHVTDPQIVVSEIWRVLKFDGIVYAETPFIQHVHEGQFDFTRFTESGHRYLFRRFSVISSGFNLGVATSLLWSLDFFFTGLFRSRLVGRLIRILFFWIQYLDQLIPESYNIDGACGVYFTGRKKPEKISQKDILNHYKGSQK
jgi:SAM-dependent methyltransferase